MISLEATPGFWCDYYLCRKDNIVEAINRILTLHAADFPNTACGGFEIISDKELVKIIPKVLRNSMKGE